MNLVISILKSMLNNNVWIMHMLVFSQRLMNKWKSLEMSKKVQKVQSYTLQINRINETLNKLESYTDGIDDKDNVKTTGPCWYEGRW